MNTTNGLEAIAGNVIEKFHNREKTPAQPKPTHTTFATHSIGETLLGTFSTIEEAIYAAEKSYREYKNTPIRTRIKMIEAIRTICRDHVKDLARLAVEETKMGRYEDKIVKNLLVINKTPGVEDLSPTSFTGDEGLTILERSPFGVIGSITPCTNPTETIICNAIGMLAGGNTVVFNTHPSAKKVSAFTINLLNKAIISEGGPPNLLTTIASPTIQSAQVLMKHPKIAILVVTGGPAVVETAMKCGKKVIAAGPGNPPVVVDETADLDAAGRDIVMSAGTDNNIVCIVEKEIIVTKAAAEGLRKSLIKHGAVELGESQAHRLEKILIQNGAPNKNFIGKDIQVILKEIGLEVEPEKRIAFVETRPDHPFAITEMLMPILSFIVVNNIDDAIELAYKLEGGCFHTSVIHSKNIDSISKMNLKMNTSIFVANGPALAGLGLNGEGPTSFTIASPSGEGVTTARHFTRSRRTVVRGHLGTV